MDMDEDTLKQLFAELIDAEEQAMAVLITSVGDVVGRSALAAALDARLAKARAAQRHPMRDALLSVGLRALKV